MNLIVATAPHDSYITVRVFNGERGASREGLVNLRLAFTLFSEHFSDIFRRGIGGGVIFLLILLAISGGVLRHADDETALIQRLNITPENIGEMFGEKRERQSQIDQAFPAGTSLSIENPHGDVTVMGRSGDDQIHIVVNKQIYSSSDSAADDKAQALDPRVAHIGNSFSISIPAVNGASADVSITIPDSGQTSISARHGDIHISSMKGPVNATANYGDMEISNIAGAVITHMNHSGSSFTARNVTGDLSLKGHADNLTISDVSGSVTLEGDFYGDTHLEHLAGPISFKTNRTQWSLARLDGSVDMSSDAELTASQIVGPTVLTTRSRNISFDRVQGDVSIINSNGTIDLTNAAPLGNITVENKNGAVNLTLPEHVGFSITAENHDGDIDDDFGISANSKDNTRSLFGTVGDGHARISLKTTHGDLNIHKGDVLAPVTPPAIPSAPAPPPAPHTKAKKSASPKTVDF